MELYLVEYYTIDPATKTTGWDIRFAWVYAVNPSFARTRAADLPDFDCVISCRRQSGVFDLALGAGEPRPLVLN